MEEYIKIAIEYQAVIYSPALVMAIIVFAHVATGDKGVIEAIRESAFTLFGGITLIGSISVFMDLMGLIQLLLYNPK